MAWKRGKRFKLNGRWVRYIYEDGKRWRRKLVDADHGHREWRRKTGRR